MFLIVATGVVEIWMVMVMAFVLGVVNAIDMPMRQALASDLVPRHLLHNAIALNSMAFNGARVVGPALAGVIIAAGTGLTGSALTGRGHQPRHQHGDLCGGAHRPAAHESARDPAHGATGAHPPVLESLREGICVRGAHAAGAVVLVLLGGIAAFGFNFQILLPLFATGILAPGRRRLRRALRRDGHRLAGRLVDAGLSCAAAAPSRSCSSAAWSSRSCWSPSPHRAASGWRRRSSWPPASPAC